MNGYEKRTNIKKEAILDSARELFTVHGIQAVSINEIAKRAGVSPVSIYNYFGDKNTLAKEVFISCIETALRKYDEIMERNIPFNKKLILILQDKSEMINQIALSNFDKKALDDKTLHQIFQEALIDRVMSLYQRFIELGKKEGSIDENIPTEAVLDYFMLSMPIFQHPDFLATSNDYKTGMIDLFLYGIIGKK